MKAQLKVLQEIIDLCETAMGDDMMSDEEKAEAPEKDSGVKSDSDGDESSDVDKLKALAEE